MDLRDPAEAEVARRVAVAWRELRRGAAGAPVRDHFLVSGPGGIEQGPMDTLDVLMARRDWRMSELVDALRVDPSTATRAVQRLQRQGLAERRTCGDDGRVVIVRASRAGCGTPPLHACDRTALTASARRRTVRQCRFER